MIKMSSDLVRAQRSHAQLSIAVARGPGGWGNEGAVGWAEPAPPDGFRRPSLCQRTMGSLHSQILKGHKMGRGFRVLHVFPNHVEFYNRSLRGVENAHAGGCREHPGSIVPRTRSVEQRPAFPLELLASGLDWSSSLRGSMVWHMQVDPL